LSSTETGNEMRSRVADEPLVELRRRRAEALAMGGPERIARHHESGRLTARERIEALVDPGSWHEIGLLALPEIRRDEPSPGDAMDSSAGI
jgi:acetyl-CoA carboxylase carboxyltransferase component